MDAALREWLMKLIAMVGSDHDGEFINAARAADRLLRQHKLIWHHLLSSNRSDTALVTVLQSELASAKQENQRLRARLATRRLSSGQSGEDHASQAKWALELHYQDGLALNACEIEFFESAPHGPGCGPNGSPVVRVMLEVLRGQTSP
jgi:hypothetical protein